MEILGIDIGGSGIKGGLVNVETGELVSERLRLNTPQPATPKAVVATVDALVKRFAWGGVVGCTFPAIMRRGVAHSAANVDSAWIGTNAEELIRQKTGNPSRVINDADAAGVAEISFGAGRDVKGIVVMLTIGTGIGSAIFLDGKLLPNTELGHLELGGKVAEHKASDRVREEEELSWKKWGARLNKYLNHVQFLFSPDLFIIGGGVSKRFDLFSAYLKLSTPIVPAQLKNDAGIVGAAMAAIDLL